MKPCQLLRKAPVLFSILAIAVASQSRADPTTQPSTQPTIASVLADMDAAYAKLQSAQFDGKMIGHFDAGGQKKDDELAFTSSFSAPNQFRHEVRDQILLGSTGTIAYSYLTSRDEYQTADAPKSRAASTEWPTSITSVLQGQNPSLLLAMSKSAADELNQLSRAITLESPVTIDGIACDALRFDVGEDHQIITMLVDPTTHLLRQVKVDLSKPLASAGTADVKSAEVTIDYTHTVTDASIPNNAFAWTAPAGASIASAAGALAATDDGMSDGVKDLIGKPAPDFSLKGLDGATTRLSDQKGSVTIVDFWATWCGPCMQALPGLDKLYKEQQPAGLKVFAVDLQEDKDTVKAVVVKQGWSIPVLLDSDGAVAGLYKADAIPETVVIGKDGKIKQIFVGGGHEEQIAAVVAKEMK